MFDRILVPLDGSLTAEAILPKLRRLLTHEDSEVLLLHVLHVGTPPDGYAANMIPTIRKDSETYLQGKCSELSGMGIHCRTILAEGSPAETILHVAEKEGASLICMSSHGRSGVLRWVFGSVTEKVLRDSPCPMYLARALPHVTDRDGDIEKKEPEIRHILIPYDGSDCARRILPTVREFARRHGARATALMVTPPIAGALSDKTAEDRLVPIRKELESADVPVELKIERGSPARAIKNVAQRLQADVIAMATHGESGFRRLVFGSVAENLLRTTSLPILIVRNG